MAVNDPVGDLITRIRNATLARHDKLTLPSSKLKVQVVRCLKDEGFVADFVVHERARESVISGIRRVSKPGLRRYVSVDKLPRVRGGTGISILSTSRGVLSDGEARKQNVGGELICTVY
jgi:small subunit ribosomal protein S8